MDRIIFIVCDGLADRPIKELQGKTPLEGAKKTNLDSLAQRGIVGLVHTIDRGVRPGSDVAHLALFGYNPKVYYTGRGIFEAIGIGMDLRPGDIALRGNFATIDKKHKIIDRRAGRIDNTEELVAALNKINKIEGIKCLFKKGTGHRVGVILRGSGLSAKVSDVDPHIVGRNVSLSKPLEKDKKSAFTATIINQLTQKTHEILSAHKFNTKRIKSNLKPANILLTRGASKAMHILSFKERYDLKALCIAGAGLYKGIARALGMDIIEVAGATGKPDSDISKKIQKAIQMLPKYDFIFIHIKGADSLAEDGDFLGKKKFIEKIDAALKPLTRLEDTLIVLTADHTTSSTLRLHTADPVPVLISGYDIHTDDVLSFTEHDAYKGRLGHLRGLDLMPTILDYLGRAPLYGA